jgi:hypothetical protein
MKPTIIALSGLSGAGKSTVARALAKAINLVHEPIIAPFADEVKAYARGLGWDDEKDARGRRLLEGLTVMMEDYEPGYWAARWARRWLEGRDDMRIYSKVVIAPDHRGCPGFDALIQAHGGFHFTLQRPSPEPRHDRLDALERMNPKLYEWDRLARRAGVPIDNSADDAGASAARAILEDMRKRGFSE